MGFEGIILGIVAFFLPPFPVAVRRGCGVDLLINIALCFLGWVPAVLHAWYIIIRHPGSRERRETEKRRSEARSRSRSRSRSTTRRSREYPPPRYEMNEPILRHHPPPPPAPMAPYPQQTGYVPAPKY